MAQGAAQSTEDAAALAASLRVHARAESGSIDIPLALKTYENARKPRAAYIARNTRVLQEWLHLYDGRARDDRDAAMAEDSEHNPMFWGWSVRKDWLFGMDVRELDIGLKTIPSLPPMPPDQARVYEVKDVFKRGTRKAGKL